MLLGADAGFAVLEELGSKVVDELAVGLGRSGPDVEQLEVLGGDGLSRFSGADSVVQRRRLPALLGVLDVLLDAPGEQLIVEQVPDQGLVGVQRHDDVSVGRTDPVERSRLALLAGVSARLPLQVGVVPRAHDQLSLPPDDVQQQCLCALRSSAGCLDLLGGRLRPAGRLGQLGEQPDQALECDWDLQQGLLGQRRGVEAGDGPLRLAPGASLDLGEDEGGGVVVGDDAEPGELCVFNAAEEVQLVVVAEARPAEQRWLVRRVRLRRATAA
ncbi:MAG: hypothetical protein WD794_04065 [Mycobacteriales bacterium]